MKCFPYREYKNKVVILQSKSTYPVKNILIFSAIIFILSLAACSKSSDTPSGSTVKPITVEPSVQTTALQITTTDALGNKMTGTTVILYSSKEDLASKTNPLTSGVTDALGHVLFDSLTSVQYYWSAVLDCQNNINGSVTTATPIEAHTTTSATTILSGTGTIMYVNHSANPYSVYVNHLLIGTTPGLSSTQSANMPVGSYSVYVLQNSGYETIPSFKLITGKLTCGGILVIAF
jgi:hypothetical protein